MEILMVAEFAEQLGETEWQVRHRMNDGEVKVFRVGSVLRIPVREVERILALKEAQKSEEQESLTAMDIAKDLKLSDKTVYRLLRNNEIPCYKKGRSYRTFRSDYEKWKEGCIREAS